MKFSNYLLHPSKSLEQDYSLKFLYISYINYISYFLNIQLYNYLFDKFFVVK